MKVINNILGFDGMKIVQDTDGFKFSLDSVLLANFVTLNKKINNVMDIGCGNGIISILLSMRTNAKIIGVEIQNESYLNSLESDSFDVVVCNPPYFSGDNVSKTISKKIARHSFYLDYNDVILISKKILKNNGIVAIVHRPENLMEILFTMRKNNIEPKKIRFVYPYKGKNANILLVEGMKNGKPGLKIMDPLYVYENGEYTEEIKNYFS